MKETRPTVVMVHYSASPIVGGVEAVMTEHARIFVETGYPTRILVGRGGDDGLPEGVAVDVIPEIDTEHPENLAIASALDRGQLVPEFSSLSARIEQALASILSSAGVVIAHNVMTTHFNLPLTSAVCRLLGQGRLPPTVVWCHDISRYVNPSSGAPQRTGPPWDLLRTYHPDLTYVAVSEQRRQTLAQVLGCSDERIDVIPNGVNPATLLGLSDLGQNLAQEFDLLNSDLILLMPVRITRLKNIEFALDVTAALKQSGLRVHLLVSGPPDPHAPDVQDYFDQLRARRRTLQLEGQAIFVYEGTWQHPGPLIISDMIVGELYRLADLILMPSHREGFGMPVVEAGLADKPVFVTPIPAVEEIGEAAVHLIAHDESPRHVARRIKAWADEDPAHALRRRARQSYTWRAIFAARIEPLITTLAARKGGRAR